MKAETFAARAIGLLGRSSLAHGEGLWLEPCAAIHMFFMRFAIDTVFVDHDHLVTRALPNLRPWRLAAGGRRAVAALELPAGTIEASGTREGDALQVEEFPG